MASMGSGLLLPLVSPHSLEFNAVSSHEKKSKVEKFKGLILRAYIGPVTVEHDESIHC